MSKRLNWVGLAVVAIGLSVLLSAVNLFLGDLNQDEGWYLYAAKQVAGGEVLYRDFMFTQGPVLPVIYGVLFPVVEKFGVAGGRLITALFGLGSVAMAAWLAARAAKRYAGPAALCALILVGINVYQSYFTTIVKTYSLCAFFLTAGFVALSFSNGKRGSSGAFWGGCLLALAACTRLSAGIALPVAGLWLVVNHKKVFPFSWLAFGLGGGLVLVMVLGSFFVLAPENTQFALFGYHTGRSSGSWVQLLAMKAGFVSRFVQAYFVLVAGCAAAFVFRKQHRHAQSSELEAWDIRPHLTEVLHQAHEEVSPFTHGFISLLWMAGLGITLVHFFAPFPYDDYQVIVFPLLAAALAATLIPRCPEKQLVRVVLAVLLVSTPASFSSPMNQSWLISGRDRIWWTFKETPDLLALQNVGKQIREELGEDGLLLTQDTYLAIEAGARVPHGLEMGPFSYYPDLSNEEARRLHLVNQELFVEILQKAEASVAAFSGYGLTIRSPEISELSFIERHPLCRALEAGYKKSREVPDFGQARTTLKVYKRR